MVNLGLVQDLPLYVTGAEEADSVQIKNSLNLDAELQKSSVSQPQIPIEINFTDKLLYIYTSGKYNSRFIHCRHHHIIIIIIIIITT